MSWRASFRIGSRISTVVENWTRTADQTSASLTRVKIPRMQVFKANKWSSDTNFGTGGRLNNQNGRPELRLLWETLAIRQTQHQLQKITTRIHKIAGIKTITKTWLQWLCNKRCCSKESWTLSNRLSPFWQLRLQIKMRWNHYKNEHNDNQKSPQQKTLQREQRYWLTTKQRQHGPRQSEDVNLTAAKGNEKLPR